MMRFVKFFNIMIICCSMFTGDAQQNIGALSEENVLECPKEDTPIHMLRAKDIEKLTEQKIQILDKLHIEFKQLMSIKSPKDFSQSEANKQLNIKIVIWHFKFLIEHLFEEINRSNLKENSNIAALGMEMKKEWTNLMLNDFKTNSNKEICLLHGFVISKSECINLSAML
uniref:NR LBD domain-containing protein n=1 Tax=Globodera pallida TaxID=36090 RepID=A0A183CET4_GLOPA